MSTRIVTASLLEAFRQHLFADEKSLATVNKYLHDLSVFTAFAKDRPVEKQLTVDYKSYLENHYSHVSANSMLAALNAFLHFCGWLDAAVRHFKVQREAFVSEKKELTRAEYLRLVQTAQDRKNERLSLVLQTICGTGIRVSELKSITVEAVRAGEANVACKGKRRKIILVSSLRKKLLSYAERNHRKTGCIFVTRSGKPLNRTNIWREMKELCKKASVSPQKVFPHNLRHLFARTFYGIEKDIAKLADILGHSNINTTRIYIITTGVEHRRKMESMHLIL